MFKSKILSLIYRNKNSKNFIKVLKYNFADENTNTQTSDNLIDQILEKKNASQYNQNSISYSNNSYNNSNNQETHRKRTKISFLREGMFLSIGLRKVFIQLLNIFRIYLLQIQSNKMMVMFLLN